MSSKTTRPITISEAVRQQHFDIKSLQERMDSLHPIVENNLLSNRARARAVAKHGVLTYFTEADFVLVAREEFHKGEKLCLRWRGPRRVTKAVNDFEFKLKICETEACPKYTLGD